MYDQRRHPPRNLRTILDIEGRAPRPQPMPLEDRNRPRVRTWTGNYTPERFTQSRTMGALADGEYDPANDGAAYVGQATETVPAYTSSPGMYSPANAGPAAPGFLANLWSGLSAGLTAGATTVATARIAQATARNTPPGYANIYQNRATIGGLGINNNTLIYGALGLVAAYFVMRKR